MSFNLAYDELSVSLGFALGASASSSSGAKGAKPAKAAADDDEDFDMFGDEEEEEGDDDNKEYVGEVCGSAIAVKLAFNELGGLQEEGLRNEVVSKEALNLGLFIPQSAQSLGKADRPVPGTPVYSNQPVFLSQDLYYLTD